MGAPKAILKWKSDSQFLNEQAEVRLKVVDTAGRSAERSFFISVYSDDDDADGVLNDLDNCRQVSNADQADLDGDGIGDSQKLISMATSSLMILTTVHWLLTQIS